MDQRHLAVHQTQPYHVGRIGQNVQGGEDLVPRRMAPPAAADGFAGEPARLVPSATRRFRADRTLFCQYELFGYAGTGLAGIARVRGGYVVTDARGRTVAAEPPTAIAPDGSRVVRRLALPLAALSPGRYALTFSVEDQLAGRTFTASAPFAVEAAGGPQP